MRIIKVAGRVLLILLVLLFGYQVLLTTLGVVGAFSVSGSHPEEWGRRLGALTGQLFVLVLCIWAFRKLGTKT